MSFARYAGAAKGIYDLVPGKVYRAKSAMGGSASGGGMSVMVPGMSGWLHVTVDGLKEGKWEVAEKAYAVVLRADLEDFDKGEVAVVTDWSEDGKLEVEGLGYVAQDGLELLDRTNVFPGIRVMETWGGTGLWKRVVAVDDALWVRVNGEFKSPEEFVFPVSWDGDLLTEPLVTCLSTQWAFSEQKGLTKGRKYYLEQTEKEGKVVVTADDGKTWAYPGELFRMG